MKLNKTNFIKILNKYFKFEKQPIFAVAVSGGPDSMALLHLLDEWNTIIKGELIALIVDHNLRSDSSQEALLVKKSLIEKKIKTKILKVKKNRVQKKNMNEARENRYELLTNFCKLNNIIHLFVAHHKDDNLETFVSRKIAGSDFEGLSSMSYITTINKVCILRPLLNFTKNNIIEYNSSNQIQYITDPTNENSIYTRPIIRKFLQNTDPSNIKMINKDFENIRFYLGSYQKMIAELMIKNIENLNTKSVQVNYDNFLKLHNLQSEKLVKKIFRYLYNINKSLRSKKVQTFINEVKQSKFKSFNLSGMSIKKVNNSLLFLKKTD